MNGPVELAGAVASGLLVLVAIGASWWAGLRLERDLITAAVRAAAQLALLGLVLVAMIAPGQPEAKLELTYNWDGDDGLPSDSRSMRKNGAPSKLNCRSSASTSSGVTALSAPPSRIWSHR